MPATTAASPASKARTRRGSAMPDALALLKAEHAAVDEMFKRFEKSRRTESRQRLAEDICRELTIHATIEEEIFYPALREAIEDQDLIDEADVEHASAKELIARIRAGGPEDSHWEAMVIVLGEYIRHHVKEEHGEIFRQARKSGADLRELGQRLSARRAELEKS